MTYPNGVPNFVLEQFYDPGIILVSGTGPNVFGHALLRLNKLGPYVHVDEPYNYPKFMDSLDGYLKKEKKIVWDEVDVLVPDLNAARAELNRVAQAKWAWLGVIDNCVSFANHVLNAGGAGIPDACSTLPNRVLTQVLRGLSPTMNVSYSIQSEKGFDSYLGNDDL